MKLAVFNGSPRGKNSNTSLLLHSFIKGFQDRGGKVTSVDLLIRQDDLEKHVRHFIEAEAVMLASPLYVDSVPGMVKEFIEVIGNYDGSGKKILFLIHSGFPEGIHSVGVSNYFQLLVQRWKMKCLGIIVLPGSEGIRIRHKSKNHKFSGSLNCLEKVWQKRMLLIHLLLKSSGSPINFPK